MKQTWCSECFRVRKIVIGKKDIPKKEWESMGIKPEYICLCDKE